MSICSYMSDAFYTISLQTLMGILFMLLHMFEGSLIE